MDEAIKEMYGSSVRAQEREIEFIRNRLEFINWLFGIASALLLSSVVAAQSIVPCSNPWIAPELKISLAIGMFSFLAIICSFIGKWQGYNSIGNRITILTLLDIQKSVFLKDEPPAGNTNEKIVRFINYEYLPNEQKEKYDECLRYEARRYSEVCWLILISILVFASLSSMAVLLCELAF